MALDTVFRIDKDWHFRICSEAKLTYSESGPKIYFYDNFNITFKEQNLMSLPKIFC